MGLYCTGPLSNPNTNLPQISSINSEFKVLAKLAFPIPATYKKKHNKKHNTLLHLLVILYWTRQAPKSACIYKMMTQCNIINLCACISTLSDPTFHLKYNVQA